MARQFITGSLLVLFIAIIFSCNQAGKQAEEQAAAPEAAMTDSAGLPYLASTASQISSSDSGKRFIRKADLRFRVQDVARSTYAIEDAVKHMGGYVAYTNLAGTKESVDETPVSKDSSLETTYYTVINSLTVRVPNQNLDTLLKEIAREVDFLDAREIQADDVTLQYASYLKAADRQRRSATRLKQAIDKRHGKLSEVEEAEDNLEAKEERTDESVLSRLRLDDNVSLSTVKIDIYQRQSVQRVLLATPPVVKPYKPGFWTRMGDSFLSGFEVLQEICLFLTRIWGVVFMIVMLFLAVRIFGKSWRRFVRAGNL